MRVNLCSADPHGDAPAFSDVARRYNAGVEDPLISLLPHLLDRGDPAGRELALMIANMARTPRCLEALRDFALGQRGPDEARFRAAQTAHEADVMPVGENGAVRLWQKGKWQELFLLGFEIHDEPTRDFPPATQKRLQTASQYMRNGEAEQAEAVFRRTLEDHPDEPSLTFNLAQTLTLQGRTDEADALIQSVHEKHPDYLFATVTLARQAIDRGELAAAEELLKPLTA